MNTSNMDDKHKDYINLMCDNILAKKLMMSYGVMNLMGGMGAPMESFGGMGVIGATGEISSMGGMGGFGAPTVGIGGMGVFEAPPGGIGAMCGFGTPPGGFMASMSGHMPSIPTTNDGFISSPFRTTQAHTSEVANEDETNDEDVKDGEDRMLMSHLFL
jgi:hypothetical protein